MMFQKINYIWRLFGQAVSFTVFGIGGVLIPVIAAPIIRLSSKDTAKRQRMGRQVIHNAFRVYIHFMRFIGLFDWEINHPERLQRRNLLVLANHPTLLDVVFLVAVIPHADCIVKASLKSNFAMGSFIKLTGFIANDQDPELILENARQSINNGGALIIFPEGTRSTPGQPLNFQRSAANIAIRAQQAITPVTIRCTPITLSKQHRWYDTNNQKTTIKLNVGSDISVETYKLLPPSLAARKLTRNLERYFTQDLRNGST